MFLRNVGAHPEACMALQDVRLPRTAGCILHGCVSCDSGRYMFPLCTPVTVVNINTSGIMAAVQ